MLYKDKYNNNYYIKGYYNSKEHLFNKVMKFEVTEDRLSRLKEVEEDYNIIDEIITGIKKYLPYEYENIIYIL